MLPLISQDSFYQPYLPFQSPMDFSWLLHGGDYFTDLAGLRGFTHCAPTPLETPRITVGHIWWSAVQMRQRAEGRVCRRRGDPRLYKLRSSLWAGVVRHSDPAEAGSPDIEPAAKIAFQTAASLLTILTRLLVGCWVCFGFFFPFKNFCYFLSCLGHLKEAGSCAAGIGLFRLRYMDTVLRPIASIPGVWL